MTAGSFSLLVHSYLNDRLHAANLKRLRMQYSACWACTTQLTNDSSKKILFETEFVHLPHCENTGIGEMMK